MSLFETLLSSAIIYYIDIDIDINVKVQRQCYQYVYTFVSKSIINAVYYCQSIVKTSV